MTQANNTYRLQVCRKLTIPTGDLNILPISEIQKKKMWVNTFNSQPIKALSLVEASNKFRGFGRKIKQLE